MGTWEAGLGTGGLEKLEGRKNATETPSMLRAVTTAKARRFTKQAAAFEDERFKELRQDCAWNSHRDGLVAFVESRDVLKQVAESIVDSVIPVVYCDVGHCPRGSSIFPDLKRKIRKKREMSLEQS